MRRAPLTSSPSTSFTQTAELAIAFGGQSQVPASTRQRLAVRTAGQECDQEPACNHDDNDRDDFRLGVPSWSRDATSFSALGVAVVLSLPLDRFRTPPKLRNRGRFLSGRSFWANAASGSSEIRNLRQHIRKFRFRTIPVCKSANQRHYWVYRSDRRQPRRPEKARRATEGQRSRAIRPSSISSISCANTRRAWLRHARLHDGCSRPSFMSGHMSRGRLAACPSCLPKPSHCFHLSLTCP
jgi:hypothetical protein